MNRNAALSQHIYLTGYRGTGKTSVGEILARRIGRPLVDLDDAVELAAGKTIRELFETDGETAFRDFETECLRVVAQRADNGGVGEVISLGGGAILRQENREMIRQSGICIWLDADAQTLAERIGGDEASGQRRPALTQYDELEEIRQLLCQREPLYREAADHRIDTAGKSVEAIADEVEKLLEIG
ncbi:MAG: shikimate kinase [Pirellulaceae bacterium]|nr:shikimate kinase [Pirellulaceae bacterium]